MKTVTGFCMWRRHDAARPTPLVVALHGASGRAETALGPVLGLADEENYVILAPRARNRTWDAVYDGFGPDVRAIDQALRRIFERLWIDESRIAIEGFSDGASYALSLGLTNGDLFSAIIALSPGFMAPGDRRGRPDVFVCHGTEDRVLPIERTSRRIVPTLGAQGYEVRYKEFPGGHQPMRRFAQRAVRRFLTGGNR